MLRKGFALALAFGALFSSLSAVPTKEELKATATALCNDIRSVVDDASLKPGKTKTRQKARTEFLKKAFGAISIPSNYFDGKTAFESVADDPNKPTAGEVCDRIMEVATGLKAGAESKLQSKLKRIRSRFNGFKSAHMKDS